MGEEQLVTLYHDIRDATGWNIGYFTVDARLFPTSAQNTGIFYAPVKLSDHRVLNLPDGRVLPSGFFQILANTNRGQNIPIQFVAPGDQISGQTIKGAVDLSTQASVFNGVVFLRYYDGAVVNGTVYAGSTPLPHVWVTVTDELGTPHGVTQTDAQGHYSAIVPFGNVTITASIGNLTRRTLVGERSLASFTLPVTIDQAMRTPADANGDGVPDWMIPHDIRVGGRSEEHTSEL